MPLAPAARPRRLAPGVTPPVEAVSPDTVDPPLAPLAGAVILHWPSDAAVVAQLREQCVPRLLLVDRDGPVPVSGDPLEDWMFADGDDLELAQRITSLERRLRRRAGTATEPPHLDEDDLLHANGRWVALPPSEAELMRVLLRRMDACALVDDLVSEGTSGASLRGRIKRLRQRIAPLGLTITTVRNRGFVLSHH